MPLTYRLFIIALVAIVPAVASIVFNEYDLRATRQAETQDEAMRNARLAAYEIDRIVAGVEHLFTAIGETDAVRRLDRDACTAYLAAVLPKVAPLSWISVLDREGTLRCNSRVFQGDPNFEDRAFFRDAVAARSFIVGEYTISRINGRALVPLAMPVIGDDGVRAVIVAALDLDWLGKRLEERGLSKGGALTIADRNGVIVARNPLPERFVGTRIPESFQRLVHAGEPGTEPVLSQDGTRRVIGYIPPSSDPASGFYVSFGISEDEAFGPIGLAFRRGLTLALLGALVALIATWVAGRYFVRDPVDRILRAINLWRGGDNKARTGMVRRGDELHSIGAGIDQLMDEVVLRQGHQQLLINELNHRVKNTLATVQAIVMLTFKGEVPVEEARQAFQARLMALSQAHDVLTRENWQHADLASVVGQTVAPYVRPTENQFRIDGPPVFLPPRMALGLSMAVHELCTNAAKYGALSVPDGTVSFLWAAERTGEGCRVRMRWQEAGGPTVAPPQRSGFGSRLVKRQLAVELNGTVDLDFAPSGVVCTILCLIVDENSVEQGDGRQGEGRESGPGTGRSGDAVAAAPDRTGGPPLAPYPAER